MSLLMHCTPEYNIDDRLAGNIVYTHMFGQDIILLNSEEVAVALLDKCSSKYSDQPEFAPAELYVLLFLCSLH